ncbi:hypothetical protein GMLC_09240 [Geomonas limicola]|uniref:Uncharacterized protein n=1 Tax=Geomonas limicola TaxID=2740186 RepID=A0A6V8N466_9BACT|nr:hypothetical protein [Geomonas limicola]GFO67345.1 hypothetical protein GMLC_09240 [Geomonas limicola]
MNGTDLIYYGIAGCVIVLFLAVVVNYSVNTIIRQLTERALVRFQERLAQETAKALAGFRASICEQMAVQERKSDTLAKLYAMLIDLVRDGKEFVKSTGKGEPFRTEKALRTFEEASRSFGEHLRKQSLHFSDDYKALMDGFLAEQESLIKVFETRWKANGRDTDERKQDNEEIRQHWARFEDRVGVIMEHTRNEFRGKTATPESVMRKWLNEVQPKEAK